MLLRLLLFLGLGIGFASAGAEPALARGSSAGADAACSPQWVAAFGSEAGLDGIVADVAVFDDGTGPALYATGSFTSAGGTSMNGLARWDGEQWSPLGSGLAGGAHALTVYDDGSGPALIVGGSFSSVGGVSASCIAKWDGAAWSPLGSGLSGTFKTVNALAVVDLGSGPALYAGGFFSTAGGSAVNQIARWDGVSWSALGSGITGGMVLDLCGWDGAGGPALYAGGNFTTAGGAAAARLARWDGASWSPLGTGMNGDVNALEVSTKARGPRSTPAALSSRPAA